jgi:hypothetical protein
MRDRMQAAYRPERQDGLNATSPRAPDLTSAASSSVIDLSTVSKAAVPALCPRLLDLEAAGQYCGVSYWTMRDLVFAGEIPHVALPNPRARDGRTIRRILIDRNDLDAFIDRNKQVEQ